MDIDEEEVVDETHLTNKEEGNVDWKKALPENAGDVCDISNQACWTLSSCKTDGFGIHQLLEENVDQYWQSDGPQPHTVTIEFPKKTDISFLLLYLDYKTDESYTPSKVIVHLGSSILDMDEGLAVMFSEPVGWQVIDVRSNGRPARAFVLQLHVVQNHQNGRDTHIRQMKVVGPARTRFDTDVRSLLATGVDASNIPVTFTSSKMAFFSSVRYDVKQKGNETFLSDDDIFLRKLGKLQRDLPTLRDCAYHVHIPRKDFNMLVACDRNFGS